jgi:transcriptional regulator GlxA family with amidase domain
MMIIGIPVYQKVDLLDVAGPYEMFNWAGDQIKAVIISEDGKPVTSINGVTFEAHYSFANAPALDVLWTPGGPVEVMNALMTAKPPTYLDYLRKVAAKASWVCSVCEGALLLAQAGLLDNHQATTHWAVINCLKQFRKVEVVDGNPRFVQSGNRLTGGGISSGLDEALRLIEILAGTGTALSVQATTQYFPVPPVQGSIPSPPPACKYSWGD